MPVESVASVVVFADALNKQFSEGAGNVVLLAQYAGVDTDTIKTVTDNAVNVLETFNVEALRGAVSGVVRLLGFGPEADAIAAGVVSMLVILMVVGYLNKAVSGDGGSAKNGGDASNSGDKPDK